MTGSSTDRVPSLESERSVTKHPSEFFSADEMEVQMRDLLPSVVPTIDDHSVPTGKAFLDGDLGECDDTAADDRLVLLGQIGQRADFFFRDDQHVRRCLRADIAKCQANVVFKNDVGGYFAVDDFFEDR